MAQERLQNRDKVIIKVGDYVKFAPNTKKGILLAVLGDSSIIGVSDSRIFPSKWGLINPLNVVKWNGIIDKPEIQLNPKITVSSTPPTNPSVGDLWIDSSE